ncbi:PIG-L family deacetylase [Flagellimonas meishanensis]|uniref:PIG-L family deacetylase n=1 Tax=Flagellimonas meishanensis TaxID=2873264 RepID=UPI001CA62963|nr:PIG-L family deacetylase [[Muricauda] meishanensis]
MRYFWVSLLAIVTVIPSLLAQEPNKPTSAEIYHDLQKLNFLGTALYIAAHPDDENTRLISYLSNHDHARTAYLSITRGDGGQNLIGPELRELLGVLRTQELLAARRVDGGEQRFTRANDFGYSKHPKETLRIWDKDKVLGDVVWAIRTLKPDVIINRFDHRTPGTNHGHHTSSAMLGLEAFDLANDPQAYPEQLQLAATWQPRRAFFNTSWWFYGSEENFEKADKSKMLKLDVGVFYPELGLSNNEIASVASSQHLCQGFGRVTTRGTQDEYVELLKGDLPSTNYLFDGIETSWSRVEGGEAVGAILYKVENNFDFKNPSKHIPDLVEAYQLLQQVRDEHWKKIKSEELKSIILDCAGLYLESSSSTESGTPGGKVSLQIEAVNRSPQHILLKEVHITQTGKTLEVNQILAHNKKEELQLDLEIPPQTPYSNPYWLNQPGTLGMYQVERPEIIGIPETPTAFSTQFVLDFEGVEITFEKPVVHRYSKPEKGELYEPFVVIPEATSRFEEKVLIFSSATSKDIRVMVKAGRDSISGNATLVLPDGWSFSPSLVPISIARKGQEQAITFTITAPNGESEGHVSSLITIGEKDFDKELVQIDYEHVPKQSILLPSTAKVVRMDIQKTGEHIAYIMGAGDNVPESLEQIGYTVHALQPEDIQKGALDKYDAVVVGIRAYNVVDALKFKQPLLFEYVKNGGNMIVQYNTANRWARQFENIAPYPLTLSRDRVTDENAPVEIIAKNHALVNFPNKIKEKDFEGWVQERGLYYPNEWDDRFTPILSMHDEDETPSQGALLAAPYGKGHYIYTGLSFFRELPAGVSGAYKLFANMLSIGKNEVKTDNNVKG